ncbi:MAG: Uma2 family endonuclease [Lachnospiraceae bacterium]|nr:Uma2 family endonuclease [Lachnospiraceae bacterium]
MRKETEKTDHGNERAERETFTYNQMGSAEGAADENILSEAKVQYACKRQGEYTLGDYYALPDEQRVELIDGVIYDMAAPGGDHQTAAAQIFRQLDDYIEVNGGSCVPFVSPIDVQLDCDDRTMVQPDVAVLCDRRKYTERCIYGAPDLVIEVLSPSTSKKDQTIKLRKYQNAGVREYWMVNLKQEKVIVYDFEHAGDVKVMPVIYGMDKPIPVQIYGGKCQITFERYFARMKTLAK